MSIFQQQYLEYLLIENRLLHRWDDYFQLNVKQNILLKITIECLPLKITIISHMEQLLDWSYSSDKWPPYDPPGHLAICTISLRIRVPVRRVTAHVNDDPVLRMWSPWNSISWRCSASNINLCQSIRFYLLVKTKLHYLVTAKGPAKPPHWQTNIQARKWPYLVNCCRSFKMR